MAEETSKTSDARLKTLFRFSNIPLRAVLYVGHAACGLGLFAGYVRSMIGGDETWQQDMQIRRAFLVSSLLTGIGCVIGIETQWGSQMKIQECAERYPVAWIPRVIHIVVSPIPLLVEFYLGPQYTQYSIGAILTLFATAKIDRVVAQFYTQAFLAQTVEEK